MKTSSGRIARTGAVQCLGITVCLMAPVLFAQGAESGDLYPPLNLNLNLPTMLAQADTGEQGDPGLDETADNYAVCAAFRADRDADLGAVLKAGCEPTLSQLSALMDNPVGNVAMLWNRYDYTRMEEPVSGRKQTQHNYMLLLQFPKKLNQNWNLINRVIFNVPSTPVDQDAIDDFVPPPGVTDEYGTGPGGNPITDPDNPVLPVDLFGGSTTGFGDMYYVGLFSPSKSTEFANGGKFLWGAGFDVGMDTASEDVLGTGKWTAGPSLLGIYLGEKFKGGALLQQYWDFAGDSDRSDVNMTNLQYIYYWSLNETTSIGAAPNILINWEQNSDNRYTVPIGIGINKTFQFGKVPVRIALEYHHTVIEPDDVVASDWAVRLMIIPAVPSALFDWMQ